MFLKYLERIKSSFPLKSFTHSSLVYIVNLLSNPFLCRWHKVSSVPFLIQIIPSNELVESKLMRN